MDKELQTMIDNMPEKTVKSLQDWHTILDKLPEKKPFTSFRAEIRRWKKDINTPR